MTFQRHLFTSILFIVINNNSNIGALCLSQLQLSTSPQGNPRGLAQKLARGRDLTFKSCPGAGNSTRAGILWKMKVKLQKNCVDQIFTGENKKKTSRIFDDFWGLRVFLMYFCLVYRSIFWFCCHIYLTKIWGVAPGLFIWSFHWAMVIHAHFLHERLWFCWTFRPCIGFYWW